MKLQEIRAIAKQHQINSRGRSKGEMIREIQQKEGNFPCFGTAYQGMCEQLKCLWREDCLHAVATRGS